MVRGYDMINGIPPRIYRNPSEIKTDIRKISGEIEKTGDMLNIRAILVDLLSCEDADNPEKIIPELESLIDEAREALYKLNELNDELSCLKRELGDARCLVGR